MNTAPVTRRPCAIDHLPRLHELVDDLPGLQVAPPRHPRRGAEDATHRAADLRRQADAHRPRLVQRDQHRLHRQAVGRPEEQLLESIDRRGGHVLQDQPRQRVADRLPQPARDLEIARPRRRDHGCRGPHRREQPTDRQVVRAQRPGAVLEVPGASCPEGRARTTSPKNPGIAVDASARFPISILATVPACVERLGQRDPGLRGHACDHAAIVIRWPEIAVIGEDPGESQESDPTF